MARIPEDKGCSLGGFDWLDRKPSLRRWFANWLTQAWSQIYFESLSRLHTRKDWDAYVAMEKYVKALPKKLRCLPTADQLTAFDREARKVGFSTSRECVETELRMFLTRAGQQKQHKAAFKVSPWCDHFATREQILEQTGRGIPYALYPDDPDAQIALKSVISEFGSLEIMREIPPNLARLFAMQRNLREFEEVIKSLPKGSPLLSNSRKLEAYLRDFSKELQAEIHTLLHEPATFSPPLRACRRQRCVYFAVRRLCRPKDGPGKLSSFIQIVLKQWPRVPSGLSLDLDTHFSAECRRRLVLDYLGLKEGQSNKVARALWHVLQAIYLREDLRTSLLKLAYKACQQARKRRKGWSHLRKALRTVFNHIGRESSNEAVFRNFELSNFVSMRNLTRAQRNRLLPELGRDPDDSVRDLTKAERMILFERYGRSNRTPMDRDADGKNSFATGYGRAMKTVRKVLGQA